MSAPTPRESLPDDPGTPRRPPPTTQQEALVVLVNAVEVAQARGAYNLWEAAEIVEALALFQKGTGTGV